MNASLKALLLAAAGSGLMSGASAPLQAAPLAPQGSGGAYEASAGNGPGAGFQATTMAVAKHACKGQNMCKGQGGCNTGDNGCKGKNSCKGKGGCATDGSKAPM